MSIRVDTSSLISGAIVCGNRGLGLLGSQIPSTGDQGAGYIYNDLTLPDDAAKEVMGLIVTVPSSGVFTAYEDSSFTLIGAVDGNYTFTYTLYVDGVNSGTATGHISIGDNNINVPPITYGLTTYNPTVITPNIDINLPALMALIIHTFPCDVTNGSTEVFKGGVIRLQWGQSVCNINFDQNLNQISSVSFDKTDSVTAATRGTPQ